MNVNIVGRDVLVDNTKLTKEYLLNVVSRLIRYIILMNAPDSDIILSNEMDFSISNEPFYYIVTFNNVEDDSEGVTHRYEHILKISRRSADCEYTMNDYVKVIDTYTEECDKVIGKASNGTDSAHRPIFVDVTKHFNVGDEIVTRYATYASDCNVYLTYLDDDLNRQNVAKNYVATELVVNYALYDHTVYDEDGTVIHAQGDVMLDDNKQMIWNYLPVETQFHWQLVNTIHDNTPAHTMEEPLD